MTYLAEAIRGRYEANSEDRLSQVFAATFNASPRFRQSWITFLCLNTRVATDLRAVTQPVFEVDRTAKGRLDILLVDGHGKPRIVHENKIDAPLTAAQLGSYSRVAAIRSALKIAIVKHYFDFEVPPDWSVSHWSEFHSYLREVVRDRGTEDRESFLIEDFMKHLQSLGMTQVTRISGADLRSWAKAMRAIREPKASGRTWYFSLGRSNMFQTACNYLAMLEQVVSLVRTHERLKKRVGKRVRFTPWLGRWWTDDETRNDIWIGFETTLAGHKRPIKIATGINFDTRKGTWFIDATAGDSLPKRYVGRDLDFVRYAREVIEYWESRLVR